VKSVLNQAGTSPVLQLRHRVSQVLVESEYKERGLTLE
jgi:hypothetical protein